MLRHTPVLWRLRELRQNISTLLRTSAPVDPGSVNLPPSSSLSKLLKLKVGGVIVTESGSGRSARAVTRWSGPVCFLELAEGDVERHEGVLAGLGLLLAVGGDLGLDTGEGREGDEQEDQERDERDGDEHGETAALRKSGRAGGGRGAAVKGATSAPPFRARPTKMYWGMSDKSGAASPGEPAGRDAGKRRGRG